VPRTAVGEGDEPGGVGAVEAAGVVARDGAAEVAADPGVFSATGDGVGEG